MRMHLLAVGEPLPLRGDALPLLLRGEVLRDREVPVPSWFGASAAGAASLPAFILSRRRRTSVGDRRLLPKASPAGLFRTIVAEIHRQTISLAQHAASNEIINPPCR